MRGEKAQPVRPTAGNGPGPGPMTACEGGAGGESHLVMECCGYLMCMRDLPGGKQERKGGGGGLSLEQCDTLGRRERG